MDNKKLNELEQWRVYEGKNEETQDYIDYSYGIRSGNEVLVNIHGYDRDTSHANVEYIVNTVKELVKEIKMLRKSEAEHVLIRFRVATQLESVFKVLKPEFDRLEKENQDLKERLKKFENE